MTSEEVINEINIKLKLVELDFFDKNCKSCIGTNLQEERECAKLKGHNFLCCKKKENYVKINFKNEKEKIIKNMVSDLLLQNSERSQGTRKVSFISDVFS